MGNTNSSEAMSKKCVECGKRWAAVARDLCIQCEKAKQGPEKEILLPAETTDPTIQWERMRVKQTVKRVQFPAMEAGTTKPAGAVRVVCVSDTHSHHSCDGHTHDPPAIPDGDILIHAGDFSYTGLQKEVDEFCTFLDALPHRTKIVIAGNHDISLHEEYYRDPTQCDLRRHDA
jgi:hypothetical protein